MLQLIKSWWAVKNIRRTLLVLYTILVLFLTLTPDLGSGGGIGEYIPFADKIVHFFLFGILTFLVFGNFGFKNTSLIIISVFLFSFLIEVLQYYLPIGRSFDLLDLLANLLGIVFVALISTRLSRLFS